MAATENGAFPGGKVGGVGDVIREAPQALVASGHQVTVLVPGYEYFSTFREAEEINSLTVEFSGALETVKLFRLKFRGQPDNLDYLVIEHPLFAACGKGHIYCHDIWEPFATDASKFALFSQALCYGLLTGAITKPDVLHLHDWHLATALLLMKYVPLYKALNKIRTIFSIHNLSLQGVRPFKNNPSALESWFPQLVYQARLISDPVEKDCLNLMRTAINLADRIHVVSPTYAREIMKPSNPDRGFIGGEALEKDLIKANRQHRLFGILNGCDYSLKVGAQPRQKDFTATALAVLETWVGDRNEISSAHFHAQRKLHELDRHKGGFNCIVASVGRLTPQKASLLLTQLGNATVMDALLEKLQGGLMIMLGSGDSEYEDFMNSMMRKHDNFIFLQGYSDQLADLIYRYCDLFLMPSSYEPCGISQMLAMRAGKPCLVHGVGGLADTVKHNKNGFSFRGSTREEQARRLLNLFSRVLRLKEKDPQSWQKIAGAAAATRFTWEKSVKGYEKSLYS